MRTAAATKAALVLTIALTAVGCSPAGTTEDNPGAAKRTAAATTSPTPSQSKSDGRTVTMPDLIKVTQTSKVPARLSDRLDAASAQFSYQDHSLTLVPVGPNEVESGTIKFAVDANLPENCIDLKPKSEAQCADIFLFGVTRNDKTKTEHAAPGMASYMSLNKDVGKSLIKIDIPPGDAIKFFALVMIADTLSTINVATGKITDEYGPTLEK